MKRVKKIMLIIAFVLGGFIILGYLNPKYSKTLTYKNHSIEYKQFLYGRDPFFGGEYQLEHSISNYDLFEQANFKLASRLCKNYRAKHDSRIAKKIQMITKEHVAYKIDLNIDSLLKYSDETFDTTIQIE